MQVKLFPSFTSITLDYLLISWVTNLACEHPPPPLPDFFEGRGRMFTGYDKLRLQLLSVSSCLHTQAINRSRTLSIGLPRRRPVSRHDCSGRTFSGFFSTPFSSHQSLKNTHQVNCALSRILLFCSVF